jgi:hypothetical protein
MNRKRISAAKDQTTDQAREQYALPAVRGLRNSSFSTSAGWVVTRLGVAMALVVVDDLYIGGSFLGPGETDAPLLIDADGVLATTVAGQPSAAGEPH